MHRQSIKLNQFELTVAQKKNMSSLSITDMLKTLKKTYCPKTSYLYVTKTIKSTKRGNYVTSCRPEKCLNRIIQYKGRYNAY